MCVGGCWHGNFLKSHIFFIFLTKVKASKWLLLNTHIMYFTFYDRIFKITHKEFPLKPNSNGQLHKNNSDYT